MGWPEMLARSPHRRAGSPGAIAIALLVVLVAATTAGCSDAADGQLQGLQRSEPLRVGGVEVTEVAPDGTTTPFTMRAPDGGLLIVYFGYTNCPDVCPTTMVDLRNAFGQLGEDTDRPGVAFVSVDPERDTPEVMHRYLDHFFDRYHAIRPADIAELARAEEAFVSSSTRTTTPDGDIEVGHSATTYVVDSSGTVLDEWAFGTSSEVMAEDLRILIERTRQAQEDRT